MQIVHVGLQLLPGRAGGEVLRCRPKEYAPDLPDRSRSPAAARLRLVAFPGRLQHIPQVGAPSACNSSAKSSGSMDLVAHRRLRSRTARGTAGRSPEVADVVDAVLAAS